MIITVETDGKEFRFQVPTEADKAQETIEQLRMELDKARQDWQDRDMVVKAQDARIHELSEEVKAWENTGMVIHPDTYTALQSVYQSARNYVGNDKPGGANFPHYNRLVEAVVAAKEVLQ